jgi:hypothetical protein
MSSKFKLREEVDGYIVVTNFASRAATVTVP